MEHLTRDPSFLDTSDVSVKVDAVRQQRQDPYAVIRLVPASLLYQRDIHTLIRHRRTLVSFKGHWGLCVRLLRAVILDGPQNYSKESSLYFRI